MPRTRRTHDTYGPRKLGILNLSHVEGKEALYLDDINGAYGRSTGASAPTIRSRKYEEADKTQTRRRVSKGWAGAWRAEDRLHHRPLTLNRNLVQQNPDVAPLRYEIHQRRHSCGLHACYLSQGFQHHKLPSQLRILLRMRLGLSKNIRFSNYLLSRRAALPLKRLEVAPINSFWSRDVPGPWMASRFCITIRIICSQNPLSYTYKYAIIFLQETVLCWVGADTLLHAV